MSGDEKLTDRGQWINVRFGHRVLKAKRLGTGNWRIEEAVGGAHVATVNHGDFLAQYEKLPDDYQVDPP